MDQISSALEKFFGYSSFLPYQEEIVRDILEGRDVFAVMATGGGKSLCYQLPALLLDGLTIVVSPLISLMKDQVDALRANGIPAATLNSTLSYREKTATEQALAANGIHILYISPERLLQPAFLAFLKSLDIRLIAIDEAHCISMWGHQFRPEYRQLRVLKEQFPDVPIIALTATAIPTVQEDIIQQLNLSTPKRYVGSFNRPNLTYHVRPKKNMQKELLAYLREHVQDSGIIYCFSQKATVELADMLRKSGFRALPYHAGLPDPVRSETQEKFIRGDVEIVCATIAFGMGIDKPDVRYVIHVDLPKDLESYYQETGRAGRDGEPGDCILFYSRSDYGKIRYLIENESKDSTLKQVAYRRLSDMVNYCESPVCRRSMLLKYFGESYPEKRCDACDQCLSARVLFDATGITAKILTCVSRLSGRYGAGYIADIMTGSKSQRVLSSGHNSLPEYGSGRPYSREQVLGFIRELVWRGYLAQVGDPYPVVQLTHKSREILDGKARVALTIPDTAGMVTTRAGVRAYNPELFEHLRRVRKSLADAEHVPPYAIFSDRSLREMATRLPGSEDALLQVHGVSQSKVDRYGSQFLETISRYRTGSVPIASLPQKDRMAAKKPLPRNLQATADLYRQGVEISGIAKALGLSEETIASHLAQLIGRGEEVSLDRLVEPPKQRAIMRALETLGSERIQPIREQLGEGYTYGEIRLVRAQYLREQKAGS